MAIEAALKVRGSINAADYETAYRLAARPEGLSRFIVPSVLLVLFLMLVVYPLALREWIAATVAAAALVLALVFIRRAPSRAAKQAMDSPLTGTPLELTFTGEGLTNDSTYGTMRLPWNLFRRFKRSPDMVLLYQTDYTFQIVPRHWFVASDWVALNSLLDQHTPPLPKRSARDLLFLLLLWLVLVAGLVVVGFQAAGYPRR